MIKYNNGSILLTTVILILILGIVQIAVLYFKSQDEIIGRQEVNISKSYFLADAGFERMRQWLTNLVTSPNPDQFPEDIAGYASIETTGYVPWGTITLGAAGETYLASIYKDNVRSGPNERYYNIQSTGTATNMIKVINSTVLISTNTPLEHIISVINVVEQPAKRSP
ncbi:MAG: hypothetical protein LHV68_09035 [Elusimicrobia bacterium]|nr:hypothetical protein [Candidatus Liberimonas magnetica]